MRRQAFFARIFCAMSGNGRDETLSIMGRFQAKLACRKDWKRRSRAEAATCAAATAAARCPLASTFYAAWPHLAIAICDACRALKNLL
jgi:hypothetical protein